MTHSGAFHIAYSMPASFVTDLADDIETITGKKAEQTDNRTEDAGETALIRARIKQARDFIANLNASVRNKFRTNPEILAEWFTASRIHRTGSRKPEDTPPVPEAELTVNQSTRNAAPANSPGVALGSSAASYSQSPSHDHHYTYQIIELAPKPVTPLGEHIHGRASPLRHKYFRRHRTR
jgi:hypothetical protein